MTVLKFIVNPNFGNFHVCIKHIRHSLDIMVDALAPEKVQTSTGPLHNIYPTRNTRTNSQLA